MSMLRRPWRLLALIPGLLLALAMQVAASAPAPDTAQLVALPVSWQAPLPAPAAAAPAQPLLWRVLLPVVVKAPTARATVRFGAGRLDEQLVEVGDSFAFGLTTLYYEVTVSGDAGGRLSEQWSVRGQRQPALDRELELPPGGGSYISGVTLSTGAPLPSGSYELRLLLGDQPIGTGRVEIR
jgi:hypothetical protein